MITQRELYEKSLLNGVPVSTIDKDWVLGHFLNAMYSIEDFRREFVFKGGTCLKKCWFDPYRFSEDLDFTLLDKTFKVDQSILNKISGIARESSGVLFQSDPTVNTQIHNDIHQGYLVELRYWGANHKPNSPVPNQNRWLTSIKIDISFSEKMISNPETKGINHPYSDNKKIISNVTSYSFNEIVAEKLRALVQRNRPRDIFDNWFFINKLSHSEYSDVKNLLIQKAQNKGVIFDSIQDFVNPQKKRINQRAWNQSLKHQMTSEMLPDFNQAYDKLYEFIDNILNS